MLSRGTLVRSGWLARLSVLTAALVVMSCSSSPYKDQKPVFPVTGQVLVNNKPAAGAFVLFIPVNESADPTDPRPRGTTSEDGTFKLSTYGENDGAPAGDYYVTVMWGLDGRDDEDQLKGRYREPGMSKLKATVTQGPTTVPPFKLTK